MKRFILFLILLTLLTLQTQRTQQTFSQWYQQQIPLNQDIYGIKFIDTLNGWACTTKYHATAQDTAFILHTTNGGTNWFIQYYRTTIQIYTTMTMVNNMVGYAAGDSMVGLYGGSFILLKTINGGLNWFNIPIPYNQSITQFYFINPDTGWEADDAASGPDARLTTDGGYTWQMRTNGINDYPTHCIFFLNYYTGFSGNGAGIYKTTNAGMNWFQIGYFGIDDIYALFFYNNNIGWVGMDYDSIAYTSNGGLNWVGQNKSAHYSGENFYFFDSLKGWSGAAFEQILKTTNGGLNWGYQIDSGFSTNISFIDSSKGWTGSVKIYHTTNGGGIIIYIGIINISNKIPEQYKLFQNYPNPFNPSTKIRFSLIKPSTVQLKVFDVSGKEMTLWKSNQQLSAGTHEIKFDGSGLASGVYFYQIIVTDLEGKEVFRGTKKMILLK